MYTNSQKKKLRKAAKTDAARKSHSGISTAEEISNAAMPLCQPYIFDLRQHISSSCGHSYILSFCVSKPTCQNSCVKVSSAISGLLQSFSGVATVTVPSFSHEQCHHISLHIQSGPYELVAQKLLAAQKTSIHVNITNQPAQVKLVLLNVSWVSLHCATYRMYSLAATLKNLLLSRRLAYSSESATSSRQWNRQTTQKSKGLWSYEDQSNHAISSTKIWPRWSASVSS